jgi:hypothetical protein
MKTWHIVLGAGVLAALALVLGVWFVASHLPHGAGWPGAPWPGDQWDRGPAGPRDKGPTVAVADYRLADPQTHENLSVFLIRGPDVLPGKTYLTLQEALQQGLAVVHETGSDVLAIENLALGQELFVQSGDIVKGGTQDRTIAYDLVASPRSGRLPLACFCVEHDRSFRRGDEPAEAFSSSSNALSSNGLKLAVRARGSQEEVWANVEHLQRRLSDRLGAPVQSEKSTSSLQLSLENPRLREAVAPYLARLGSAPDGQEDVIGAAFVLNGKVLSADVYASNALFAKMWPKMLESSAVEAVAEHQPGRQPPPVAVDAVKAFLQAAEQRPATTEPVTRRTFVLIHETGREVLVETCDQDEGSAVIHRCFLAR